jgi:hypothetical protein
MLSRHGICNERGSGHEIVWWHVPNQIYVRLVCACEYICLSLTGEVRVGVVVVLTGESENKLSFVQCFSSYNLLTVLCEIVNTNCTNNITLTLIREIVYHFIPHYLRSFPHLHTYPNSIVLGPSTQTMQL